MEDELSKTPGDAEEDNKDSGWITVTKRRSEVRKAIRAACAGTPVSTTNAQEPTLGRHSFRDVKKNHIRGSKMPPLPCEETKVVVRPRGGLCISKSGASVVAEAIWSAAGLGPEERNTDTMCPNHLQNIMVVNTSSQENVRRYVKVVAFTVAGQRHKAVHMLLLRMPCARESSMGSLLVMIQEPSTGRLSTREIHWPSEQKGETLLWSE
ncbi:hypothetical protein HPB51_024493 [Rhipicephalus microplus]|uniref:Uncharacterized protein n=1 Tax=Rhipicephalus microplus TaxID=6941 RepID=A0A9J6D8F2_RHIMP|nr:hypothetical protein HPB51_024493 [Rhipicephalus microplus]